MKAKISALALISASLQSASAATLIAGIDAWDSVSAPTVTHTLAGITATATASASTGSWSNDDRPSDLGRGSSGDGTWGNFDGNGVAASTVTSLGVASFTVTKGRPSAEVTLTIVNNGTGDLDLAAFHLDVVGLRPNAPRTYALNVLSGSDITVGNVVTSPTGAITSLGGRLSGHDQHDDIDIDLTGLADHTLAVGETAIIQIVFSDGTGSGGNHDLFLDNLAVSGAFMNVPEPSSMILLCLAGFALLGRRFRSGL